MRNVPVSAALLLSVAGAAACHDSSDGGGQVSFQATVTDLIQNGTDDTADPVEIQGTGFAFPQDENAFDDVLPPDGGAIVPQ